MKKPELSLNNLAALSVIVVCAVMLVQLLQPTGSGGASDDGNTPPPPPPPVLPERPLDLSGGGTMGEEGARVSLIAYSEFQCPFCARFARDTMPEIKAKYIDTGQVRFVFRHLPLTSIHPEAVRAATAAECAGEQGRFWDMHDLLFESPKLLDDASLMTRARALGLAEDRFAGCVAAPANARVQRDMREGEEFRMSGTPTFLVALRSPDGTGKIVDRFSGARPFATFAAVLDRWLAADNDDEEE